MFSFITTGAILGLSAGIAPGPLLALVISETLQHDIAGGIRVALAPILTDLPIILLTVLVLGELSRFNHVLGIISMIGACFILYLGIRNMQTRRVRIEPYKSLSRSLQKGVLANFLSPHPYLFWFSVGGPITIKAMDLGLWSAVSFIFSFYFLLVGSKIFLAFMVARSRSFLQGSQYILTMRLLGGVLIVLAVLLFRDGLRLLGLL